MSVQEKNMKPKLFIYHEAPDIYSYCPPSNLHDIVFNKRIFIFVSLPVKFPKCVIL